MTSIQIIVILVQEVGKVLLRLTDLLLDAPTMTADQARAAARQIVDDIEVDRAIERRAHERLRASYLDAQNGKKDDSAG
jgi:hypothetical protein